MSLKFVKISIDTSQLYRKEDFIIYHLQRNFDGPINLSKCISRFVIRRRILAQKVQDEDNDKTSKDK